MTRKDKELLLAWVESAIDEAIVSARGDDCLSERIHQRNAREAFLNSPDTDSPRLTPEQEASLLQDEFDSGQGGY